MTNTVRQPGHSPRHVVLVHGRGCKPSAESLLSILFDALGSGIAMDFQADVDAWQATSVSLAYYGDLTNELLREFGEAYDEQLDITDLRNALNELCAVDRSKGFGVKNYDRLPGKSATREFAASIFSPIVRSTGLGKKLVGGRHKDLARYWTAESDYREQVLARVRSTLAHALNEDDRVIVISHGTGSIVAWDVLWQLSHDPQHQDSCQDLKVDVWLTLGSPLSDATVQGQLLGRRHSGRERYPTNVLAWHNVSAEDDYMSHDNTVADDFRAMLNQRQISSIRDYHIYNLAIRYGRSNPHNVLGYLIHPRVSKIVSDWLHLAEGRTLPGSG